MLLDKSILITFGIPSKIPLGRLVSSLSSNPTCLSDDNPSNTLPDSELRSLFCRYRCVRDVKLLKMPLGRLVRSLFDRKSVVSDNMPSKSSDCKDAIDLSDRSSRVIVARSTSVTALQSLTPTAFAIASATSVVRLQAVDCANVYPK